MAAVIIPENPVRASAVEHRQLRNFRLDNAHTGKEGVGVEWNKPRIGVQEHDFGLMLAGTKTDYLAGERAIGRDADTGPHRRHEWPRSKREYHFTTGRNHLPSAARPAISGRPPARYNAILPRRA